MDHLEVELLLWQLHPNGYSGPENSYIFSDNSSRAILKTKSSIYQTSKSLPHFLRFISASFVSKKTLTSIRIKILKERQLLKAYCVALRRGTSGHVTLLSAISAAGETQEWLRNLPCKEFNMPDIRGCNPNLRTSPCQSAYHRSLALAIHTFFWDWDFATTQDSPVI